MKKILHTLAVFAFVTACGKDSGSGGIVKIKSAHSVKDTVENLTSDLEAKKMTLFKVIDHSEGAAGVGLELRPTVLVIFGNPKVGTPFMQCEQAAAIDFPQKAMIYEDKDGSVWYSYDDPEYIAKRHHVKGCEESIKKISGALGKFAEAATK